MKTINQNADGTVTIDGETYKVEKEEKSGVWTPEKEGDKYRFVDAEGEISWQYWGEGKNKIGLYHLSQGNFFETEEQAQEYADFLKAKGTVSHYIRTTYPFQPDWGKDREDRNEIEVKNDEWEVVDYWGNSPTRLFPTMAQVDQAEAVIAKFPAELEVVRQYLLTHN